MDFSPWPKLELRGGKRVNHGDVISIGSRQREFKAPGTSVSWWTTSARDGFTKTAVRRFQTEAPVRKHASLNK